MDQQDIFLGTTNGWGSPAPAPSLVGSGRSTVSGGSVSTTYRFEPVGMGYEFYGKMALLTWSHTRFEDGDTFLKRFMLRLPEGAEVYGSVEDHQEDGVKHIHAVFRLEKKKHYTNARKHWLITHEDGSMDTESLSIRKPHPGQNVNRFLEDAMGYVEKDDNKRTFGKRIPVQFGSARPRKRALMAIHEEKDADIRWKMLVALDPAIYSFGRTTNFRRTKTMKGARSG
ncbi:hypothetical protein BGZ60DRAFT_422777 [Tricladium varicosporioides]|nr:hypothetical protein BGZ60DRAFT_422777 [Hymenoscyphus varicosporioides]